MSGIDAVIARARMAGDVGFSERKQFKLARRRAIEKMRRFALADPYFYILELIQAAVAGGAESIDILCAGGDVTISWIGGVINQDELAQLFDFLFASKERVDIAHVRSLALGVNALMLFEPEMVIIESGDGTPGGTSRMVVRQGSDQVDVGRAQGVLTGTYVRATGLSRGAVAGRTGDSDGSREFLTVEQRCIAAPVPLVFNGQSVFGWAKQRVPNLFGYHKVRSFDEGDLYGTIGLNPMGGQPSFQLLTHGVWIQTYQQELMPKQRFGGVVCFDRLHKTADHSGFVRDDRFQELWLRLRPYAEEILGGRVVEAPRITSVDGLEYSPLELRKYLANNPRVVAIPPELDAETPQGKAVKIMSYTLDAVLLRAPASQVSAIRVLGGRDLSLWQPDVDDPADVEFYSEPELGPPAGPQLLPAVELEPVSIDALVDARLDGDDERRPLRADIMRKMFGDTGTLTATLYAPLEPGEARRGLLVQVTSTGRLLGSKLYASTHPGRILRVEVPTASPARMRSTAELSEGRTGIEHVAEHFAARTEPALRKQDERTLAGLGVGKIEAASPAAKVALQVLARVTLTRLRAARPGRMSPGLSFSLLHSHAEQGASGNFDPLALPLLRTVAGEPISLRSLALLSDQTSGLIYGCIPEVPADLHGLDRDRILALDQDTERVLISLVGEGGYVRVDSRDRLAQRGDLRVRDLAVGLHAYPDYPLLLEAVAPGDDPSQALAALDQGARDETLRDLVTQLRARVRGHFDDPEQRLHDPATQEEHRRQAVRHLQWIACRELAVGRGQRVEALGLLDLALFTDLDGLAWGLREVHAALQSSEGLLVHYGHALGGEELALLTHAHSREPGSAKGRQSPRPASLAASAFVYRLLVPLGRVRLAFDFDLDDVEAARNPFTAGEAFLVRETVDAPWGTGVVGVPATHQSEYRIQLRTRGGGSVAALDEVARRFGLVGSLVLEDRHRDDPDLAEQIIAELHELGLGVLDKLITRLPAFGDDPRRREAGLRVLLHYAGEELSLIADRDSLTASLRTPLANRILSLPLFDIGATTLTSGQRLIEHFRKHFEGARRALRRSEAPQARASSPAHHAASIGAVDWSTVLVQGAPQWVHHWLDVHLHPQRAALPASGHHGPDADELGSLSGAAHRGEPWPEDEPIDVKAMAWNLVYWIERLRTDPREIGSGQERLPPTPIWMSPGQLYGHQLVEGNDKRLDVYAHHTVIDRLRTRPSPETLAWVLLALYAHLNATSGPITNAHEARFQRAIADALGDGSLVVLRPNMGGSVQH